MPKTPKLPTIDRRRFLKGVAVSGAAVSLAGTAEAQSQAPRAPAAAGRGTLPPPSLVAEAKEPAELPRLTVPRTNSDFMVDVVKTLGIDYLAAIPGSSFRGLQESFINYGANKQPEWLTCCHEESSVAMAHGYAKIAGKPMMAMVHATVGLQHASMAVYNAWADRAPVIIVTANQADWTKRRPGAETKHSVQDGASLVRDITKWDDQPASAQHWAESMVRAYKLAVTAPTAPVLIVSDADLQEEPLEHKEEAKLHIPKFVAATQPVGDPNALREAAKLLVAAENPVIVADRYQRTPEAIPLLVKLAELLQAPVVDQGGRMNFPNAHPLNHSDRGRPLISQADVILTLEPGQLWAVTHSLRDQLERTAQTLTKPGTKLINLSAAELLIHANYQDFERFAETDMSITGDAEASMPYLIEAVARELTDNRKAAIADRGKKLAEAAKQSRQRTRGEAANGWDLSPITLARLSVELFEVVKNEDWSFVGVQNLWPKRLWPMAKHYHHIGGSGASGIGYGLPSSIGAALANREEGRLSVSIQPDGDFMFANGVLWTAAHHKIPILMVMHNNRAYHQEVMHLQRMANRHNRGVDRAGIGTTITDPNINYAKLAEGMGVYSSGPVTDPKDLRAVLTKAMAVVKRGEPALVDVVTQPR
jgi:acetolactate synthase I/II/III large subunit